MKIVVAIDSFKDCLTSAEANEAAARGIREACPEADVVEVAVSDGGEGFLDAYEKAVGGERVSVEVFDPLWRPIRAEYVMRGQEAMIEMAQASGLMLLSQEERNPLIATSYGTGQLVADAVKRGARRVMVGLGGSATSDNGTGMLRALIDVFAPKGHWDDIKQLNDVEFTIATDVRNPLCGPQGAAHVFAPQKGASEEMVELLDHRAQSFATFSARHFGYDRSNDAGAGAAGGLGYAFMQYLNARQKSGIELLLEAVNFSSLSSDASLIITGEGTSDKMTLMGKVPQGILNQAGDTPVALIAGRIRDKELLLQAGFSRVECINPEGLALDEALRKEVAQKNIQQMVAAIIRESAQRAPSP
ncbi:MAG: glycerate kinase [Prevotella sp.]|nr:glycerate kinase [Prevotella sp.]